MLWTTSLTQKGTSLKMVILKNSLLLVLTQYLNKQKWKSLKKQ